MRTIYSGALFVILSFRSGFSHPNGLDECGPPMHDGGLSSSTAGVSITLTGGRLTLSANRFRGFLLTTDKQVKMSGAPAGTATSSLCGGDSGTWSHTWSQTLSSTSVNFSCADFPGETIQVYAYVVYSFSSEYQFVTQSVVCGGTPSVTTTTPTPTATPTSISGSVSVAYSTPVVALSNEATLSWAPSTTDTSSSVRLTFNNSLKTTGWVGIGFGTSNYYMSGGKQSVIMEITSVNHCSVSFYTLEAYYVTAVMGSDPWSISPSCSVNSTSGIFTLDFTIGGSTNVAFPAGSTTLYAILAGETGRSLGNHGSNWDYYQVDFMQSNTTTAVGASSTNASVDPYYLSHGVFAIVVFCILMPLTSFLILFRKDIFLTAHVYIGMAILVLGAVEWILSGRGNKHGSHFSSSSAGESHKGLGDVANYIMVGVVGTGVILWWIRLPKTMKLWVRYAHGIAGVAISFFGPYVVWTGWVRLVPISPPIAALDDSAIVWTSLAIALGGIYIVYWILSKTYFARKKLGRKLPKFTLDEIGRMIASGKQLLIVDGFVCKVPSSFDHPGGNAVIQEHIGKEVGAILHGRMGMQGAGGNVTELMFVPHSKYAFGLIRDMRIGVLKTMGDEIVIASAPPELDVNDNVCCVVESAVQINHLSSGFSVKLFSIRLPRMVHTNTVIGSKVYLSMQADSIARAYTIFNVIDDFVGDYRVIQLAIKLYPTGALTSKLANLHALSGIWVANPVRAPSIPSSPKIVLMLAGGTGITPMYHYILSCNVKAIVMWWLRDATDLFLAKELEILARKNHVQIYLFFTNPANNLVHHNGALNQNRSATFPHKAKAGHVSKSAIVETAHLESVDPNDVAAVISGPHGFSQAAKQAAFDIGVPITNVLSLD